MKNLKKVLAFVVVFAMMLTSAVSAASFPDVADEASYAEAATILSSLGLMIGDDMGNFNPDKILTRAEATALIMRAKGLEAASAGAAGATQFTDVAADHWASGYINLAAQSNVVAGYGDGTFGPEDEVKYEQFVKMVVAALGYEPKANTLGGYPSGYLIIASQKNITKSAQGAAGQPAARKTVAQILFNALDVNMMEQTVFVVGQEEFEECSDTLLKNYLYVDKYEGIINNVAYSTLADDSIKTTIGFKDVDGVDELVINGVKSSNWTYNYNYTTLNAGETNAATLLGYEVSAYVGEDELTGEEIILAVAPRTGRNEVVTLDYTQLAGIVDGAVEYYANASDNSTQSLELAASPVYIYNNGTADGSDAATFIAQSNATAPGVATFLNNDGDDDYDYVFVTEYDDDAHCVVNTVDAANGIVVDKNSQEVVDLEEDNTIWTIIKDGEIIALEDIAVGNVLSIAEGSMTGNTMKLKTVYVSDVIVEGAVTESRTDSNRINWYTIAGEEYADNGANIQVGDEGKFYLNVDGKVIYKEAVRVAADNYAYLLEAGLKTGLGGGAVELKFINAAGEWTVAEVASRVTIQKGDKRNTVDSTKNNVLPSPAPVMTKGYAKDFGIYTLTETSSVITAATAVPQLFQYELNSAGKVSKIYLPTDVASEADEYFSEDMSTYASLDALNNTTVDTYKTAEYKASAMKLGNVYLTENTKVFCVDLDERNGKKEDGVIISSVESVLKDDTRYAVKVFDQDIDGYASVIVVYDAQSEIDEATHPLVITKVSSATNAAGYPVTKFYGYQAGEAVEAEGAEGDTWTVTVNGSPASYTPAAGDVVIFSLDGSGAINKIDVLMKASDARAVAAEATDDFGTEEAPGADRYTTNLTGTYAGPDDDSGNVTVNNTFAYVSKTLSNNRAIINWEDSGYQNDTVTLRGQDLNFYVVNVNRDGNFSVNTGSFSDLEASNKADKAGSWAYIRTVDGAPVAVVIYSYTNRFAVSVDRDGVVADITPAP